ncbi:hypothetical protein KFK09_028670 [Dendrobium nobile]|uniref:Uncharacterized protein n=1 Tax=Dendrobium nobile TaxID=94219 RepID=A0A8T3A3Q3_DENNO|nr:hypothetical protein KFK09_028670 [Dendrobium nobile]
MMYPEQTQGKPRTAPTAAEVTVGHSGGGDDMHAIDFVSKPWRPLTRKIKAPAVIRNPYSHDGSKESKEEISKESEEENSKESEEERSKKSEEKISRGLKI